MDLNKFVKTQDTLNNLADILEKLYMNDPIKQNEDAFNELTERTFSALQETDDNIDTMINDEDMVNSIISIGEQDPMAAIKDMVHIMVHSVIAKQSIVIDQLLMKIEDLERE